MYLTLKFLHVLGVILFIGNIVTGAFWHAHALRKGDPALLAHTAQGIILSDRLFTMPGVFLILLAGIPAAVAGGFPILGTGWIFWSLILFAVSGVIFMLRLAPLQRRLHELAVAGVETAAFDLDAYRAVAFRWAVWGIIATLTPLGAAALMVLKPAIR